MSVLKQCFSPVVSRASVATSNMVQQKLKKHCLFSGVKWLLNSHTWTAVLPRSHQTLDLNRKRKTGSTVVKIPGMLVNVDLSTKNLQSVCLPIISSLLFRWKQVNLFGVFWLIKDYPLGSQIYQSTKGELCVCIFLYCLQLSLHCSNTTGLQLTKGVWHLSVFRSVLRLCASVCSGQP